jgi:hypothetical protein
MTGKIERAEEESREALQVAEAVDARRELCLVAACQSTLGLLGGDAGAALPSAKFTIERSRALGFDWGVAIGRIFEGMLHVAAGEQDRAQARFAEAFEIARPRGDLEAVGMALGGLASLAAHRGETGEALEFYAQSLAASRRSGTEARRLGRSSRWRPPSPR